MQRSASGIHGDRADRHPSAGAKVPRWRALFRSGWTWALASVVGLAAASLLLLWSAPLLQLELVFNPDALLPQREPAVATAPAQRSMALPCSGAGSAPAPGSAALPSR